ncbi:hypothetical protein B0A50_04439 [Salinomyces thailandicus]|uniref:Uncharacterized protein n=1 Tax=Salinomyces thailandicus TaxID=706561 RepID=A0A4U0TYU4_9PEZI|nr:hypothetical protein B0A50_04439 [Salinomyces thailandica]
MSRPSRKQLERPRKVDGKKIIMAYDQASPYEPPRRAYYGQMQQQAPDYGRGYGGRGCEQQQQQQQQQLNGYAQYDDDQGHRRAYDEQPQYTNGYGHDQSRSQPNGYANAQSGGHDQRQDPYYQPPRPGKAQPQQQQQQQRSYYDSRPQQRSRADPQSHAVLPPQQQQQEQMRQYDPRYQQRTGRATPHTAVETVSKTSRSRPEEQQQSRQEPLRQQHNTRNAAYGVQPAHPRKPADQRSERSLVNGTAAIAPVQPPAQPTSKKMTMEEWKAAERAKMHQQAKTSTLAQDNAFPIFPNTRKAALKNGESRPETAGGEERGSGEQSRGPSEMVASVEGEKGRAVQPQQQRPSLESKGYGSNESVAACQARRVEGGMERPHYSSGQSDGVDERRGGGGMAVRHQAMREDYRAPPLQSERYVRTSQEAYRQAPPLPQTQAQGHARSSREEYSSPPPLSNGHGYGQASPFREDYPQTQDRVRQSQEDYRSPLAQSNGHGYAQPSSSREGCGFPPSQSNGHGQPPHLQQQSSQQPQYHAQQHPPPLRQAQPQFRPGTAGGRPQIQTSETGDPRMQQHRPTYADHQPLSPAAIPPRPNTATAGSARSQLAGPPPQQPFQPPVAIAEAPKSRREQQPQSQHQPAHHNQPSDNGSTLADLYDGYGASEPLSPPPPPQSKVISREEEIEAEMPDFDSAAPQQTSALHKRNRTVDRDFAQPPVKAAPPPPLPVQGGAVSEGRGYSPGGESHWSTGVETGAKHGFDFGLGQNGGRLDAYRQDSGYGQQRAPSVPPPQQYQHDTGYAQQRAPSVQPPQPPFAQEAPRTRSMDDANARPLPYRQIPPPPPQKERSYQNGDAGRGVLPPPQRPGVGLPVYSDPGAQRRGVPPTRPGLQEAPARSAVGEAALTQQASAPVGSQRHSNPDSLPHHPVPVRPGLLDQGTKEPSKPAPIRQHDPSSTSSTSPRAVQPSKPLPTQPVTHAELEQLHRECTANPNNPERSLLYAEKLVEASTVLASDNGRADAKQTAKNRERYILDAHKRIKKLVAQAYPDAQFYLADAYGQGSLGLEVDPKEAFILYQAAAKQNHAQAAYRTAMCCELGPDDGGGTRKDPLKAVQWYRRAAALGAGPAMYKLGIIQLKALLSQPRHIPDALHWLTRAAAADPENPRILHELATLYDSTTIDPEIRSHVPANDTLALQNFRRAAALGLRTSQFRLGQAYEYATLTLPIDNRASLAWYSKAAAQGEHNAELALSGWYLTGAEGILAQSDVEAYLWARKAAMAKDSAPLPKALFAMGYYSEQGIGCPVSGEEAKKWYGRAASYRFPQALERLEELRKGGKSARAPPPPAVNGKLTRAQRKEQDGCVAM